MKQTRGRSRPVRSSRYWWSASSMDDGRSEAPPSARIRPPERAIGLEADARWALAVEHVDRVDEADGLRLVGHHEGVGPGSSTEEPNAFEEIAARDAGCG